MQRSRFRSMRFVLALLAALTLLALPATVDAARRSREVATFAVGVSFDCLADRQGNEVCEVVQVEAFDSVYGAGVCVLLGSFVFGQQPEEVRFETGCALGSAVGLRVNARMTHATLQPTVVPVETIVCRDDTDICDRLIGTRNVVAAGVWDGVGALVRQPYNYFDQFGPCISAVRGLDLFREANAELMVDGKSIQAEFGFMGRGYQSLNFFNECTRGWPGGR